MRSFLSILLAVCTWGMLSSQNMQLVWSDEFNGTELDTSKWGYQLGTGCPDLCGWGNNELEYYREENTEVSNGTLKITARAESFQGSNYTSSRIRTKDKGDWTYGRFEARIKLPKGQGIWPAFWMLPTDNYYGGWPNSGEIDIMELVGHQPSTVHGTVHYAGPAFSGNDFTLNSGEFAEDFHVFSIVWEEERIRWFVDSVQYHGTTVFALPSWPFDQRFHFLLNVAVGGNWPGSPDVTTQFPQTMEVDWVRVYQDVPNTITEVREDQNLLVVNPATDGRLWFKNSRNELQTFKLYNILGSEVTRFNLQDQLSHSLDISAIKPGTYILQATNNDGKFQHQKIVIR